MVASAGFAQELKAPECYVSAVCGSRGMRSEGSVSQRKASSSQTLPVNSKPEAKPTEQRQRLVQVHRGEERVPMGGKAPSQVD